eukprot:jgi/Mesvir1/10293/Mv16422-RA.1
MPNPWLVEVAPGRAATADKPERSAIFRHRLAKDGFAVQTAEGVNNLYDSFRSAVEKFPGNKCLGWRARDSTGEVGDYQWLTYSEVMERTTKIASAIRHCGLEPHGRVGVYSQNCPEWMMAMQACNMHTLYCVPLYDTLGADAIEFIVNHSETELVFVHADKLIALAGAVKNCASVKVVVAFGHISVDAKAKAEASGKKLYTWDDFLALGAENPVPPSPAKPEDLCTIMYTSGTTGVPKGVMLTHKMVLSTMSAVEKFLHDMQFEFLKDEVMISYLPLAHIFDRTNEEMFLSLGLGIGYWQGDVKKLLEDIAMLKPTWFPGVPRIFDRIYAGVENAIKSSGLLKKTLYNYAFERKLNYLKAGVSSDKASPFFDKILFSKIKMRLGGRVRLIVSGAAPLAPHVEDFLAVTMCCPVVQGYGLTETCAASFVAVPDGGMRGTVGIPVPSIDICLEGVPEIGYSPSQELPSGEVCMRGPTVFTGYYKRDDLTKECMDEDGFFHTGDIGQIQPDGSLKIVDRKKNMFKLSQGEYVAVEHIEGEYGKCAAVDGVWVYGNSFQSTLVAVANPNEAKLKAWGEAHAKGKSFTELCELPAAREHILAELTAIGKSAKLKGFEMVKAVHLDPKPFDVERDLITPTFKKKRPQLQKYYQAQIDAMYKAINAEAK